MALGFGRKKAAEETPATPEVEAAPVAAHAPSSPPNPGFDASSAFDLDSFSDADASGGDSSGAAVTTGSAFSSPDSGATTLSASESDAPDFDKLYEIEQLNAQANAARTPAQNAAPAPFVPPSAMMQQDAVPFYEPQIPVETDVHGEISGENETKTKKKLPLVPILGALGILALGGAASYLMGQKTPDTDDEAPPILPAKVAPRPAPKIVAAPVASAMAPKMVSGNTNPVSPGIAPVSAQTIQMKALWKQGADAKHRRNYAAARRFWSQGLKMQPTNAGFRESLAKLPK